MGDNGWALDPKWAEGIALAMLVDQHGSEGVTITRAAFDELREKYGGPGCAIGFTVAEDGESFRLVTRSMTERETIEALIERALDDLFRQ